MRIGILTAGLPPDCVGGAEKQAAHVARLLSRKHEVTIWTRSQRVPSELRLLRVIRRRHWLNCPILRFPVDLISTLLCIWRCKGKIDVLLAYQTIIDGLIGVLARRLFQIPVIVLIRSESEYKIRTSWKAKFFSPFVFKHADRIIVQSPSIRNAVLRELGACRVNGLKANVEKKIDIIPNGVTLQPMRRDNAKNILYVGRLLKQKGVRYLISAMRDCPGEKLLVVGDGPDRRNLERLARSMSNVEFVGPVLPEEVSTYMQRSRMLILPSASEASPNVVLEAMAHGLPVVATAVGGIPDLIKHGETGFLVEPADAPKIAYYIKWLAQDEKLRAKIGETCLGLAQQYRWENVLESYQAAITKIQEATKGYE